MTIKVLIADDDYGMRLVLNKIISKQDGFEIKEAKDGDDVLRIFETYYPDIIFLDVDMPKLNGIECAKKITDINPKAIIIFATAHSEYMKEAFEVYAFDYLIKPFKNDRVIKSINRAKEIIKDEVVEELIFTENTIDKLVVKNKDGVYFVDTEDIILIQREDRSSVIYTKNDKFHTSEGLCDLEKRLEKTKFYRSHKSYIINISKISKISPYGRWTYIVKFKNTDIDALMTHKKYEEIEKFFR